MLRNITITLYKRRQIYLFINSLKSIFKLETTQKIIAISFIIIILYFLRSSIHLILFTFLFSYLIYTMNKVVGRLLCKLTPLIRKLFSVMIYITLILSIILLLYNYIPKAIDQVATLVIQITNINLNLNSNNKVIEFIKSYIENWNIPQIIQKYSNTLLSTISDIGQFSLNVILALVLSIVFNMERGNLGEAFNNAEESSNLSIFKYLKSYGKSFTDSFGKVIRTQLIIGLFDATLSAIGLVILGFPQVLGLGLMIFVLVQIPVVGIMIALAPLSLIAFQIGGFVKIFQVLMMVVILHLIENYVLIPKLMSDSTKIPKFLVFVVLILSEKYMGLWGLLLGIPLFMFVLDIFNIKLQKTTQRIEKVKSMQ
ncbi:AI-2E family transporter [Clostridium sp. WILCCON 0269]|uniref:AI-2E family transporter n=1 Tax=Candidatus Clostridium eludens TaxID=3381663 RepID=A0ABW8SJ72_9CLOT